MLRRPILFASLLATAIAVPALAQTNATPLQYSQTCSTAGASQEDKDSAAKLFEVAKKSLNESDFDRAISLFKQSYDFYCAPEILLWLADAFERKGDRPEAVRALIEYKRRSGDSLTQDKKDQIDRRIKNLGGNPSATASTTTPPSTTTTPSATATTTDTGTAATTTSTSTAPTTTSSATSVPTTTSPSGQHSVVPWILVGVGGAALITGAILLPVGAGKVSDAANKCGTSHNMCGTDPAGLSAVSEGNSGRNLETVGVIVGVAGIALIAGGLIWHFVEPTAPSTATTGARVSPVVAPGYAGLAAGGTF